MIFVNALADSKGINKETYNILLQLLAPFAPHICDELWHHVNSLTEDSIFVSSWPEYDSELLQDEVITIAVQVNGKLRDTFEISSDVSEDEIKTQLSHKKNSAMDNG